MTPDRWKTIEQIHRAVLDRPPEEREAFLAALAPDIRKDVEALLEPQTATLGTAALGGPLSPGTRLGVYRLESQLGQGGMGVVFRAVDTRLNRPVAIKILSGDFADPAARRRFQREAQMASSITRIS